MSVLVLQIPPRPRHAGAASTVSELDYVLSPDGRTVGSAGRAATALLPRATRTVAVLADADLAWHRVTLPKAPPGRMRAALAGLMEDQLLDDEATLHFALGPKVVDGPTTWVAVMHRPWLQGVLQGLRAAGIEPDALRAASVPGNPAGGHFFSTAGDDDAALRCVFSGADGISSLPLVGTLPRALLARLGEPGTLRWTATPAAAEAATSWLGAQVAVLTEAQRLLQAAAAEVDLRQFDLAPRHRGLRAMREGALGLGTPSWRPVRVGLLALVALQLVGLNAWAWQQQREIDTRKAASLELLRIAHPQVRAVLDAPLQMARETAALRAVAGQLGDGDLETLLAAAAAAWPADAGPAATLRFEPGRLTLGAPGWADPQTAQWVQSLRTAGFVGQSEDGRVSVARGDGR